jgi:hypothetical protein
MTMHNHNRNGDSLSRGEQSAALPFGQKMPPGECPRCDELRGGAEPRADHAGRSRTTLRGYRNADEELAADIRAHNCRKSGCGSVCTFGQW